MLQIRTTINNQIRFIDLYGDEDVTIEVSFNEIQDITTKNSPYSQSFKLPGSKNNNDIFNHFYDFNASTFDYSPKEKFEASIYYNGIELYSGYLRLNSTTTVNTNITYDVTFYSEIGDLISNIKDKWISDLDFTEFVISGGTNYNDKYPQAVGYQPPYYDPDIATIYQSSPYPNMNGKLYFPLLNRGYDYINNLETEVNELNELNIPRLNWGYPPTQNAYGYWDYNDPYNEDPLIINDYLTVQRQYLTPSLRIKELYEKIFEENGYTVQSDFFNTAYFKKYYLPITFSNETLYPTQTLQPRLIFSGQGVTTATTVSNLTDYTWKGNGTINVPMKRFRSNLVGLDNDNFTLGVTTDRVNTKTGNYTFEIKYSYVTNDDVKYRFWVHNRSSSAPNQVPFQYGDYLWVSSTGNTVGAYYSAASSTDKADIIVQGQFNTYGTYNLPEIGFDLEVSGATASPDFRITRFEINILDGPRYTTGNTFNPQLEIPEPNIKQLDFISSINKAFNLLVIPNPNNPKSLIVEPVIDWIGKGDTLDWSNKIDRSQPITVQPLTTIINGTLDYRYKDDSGNANTVFKSQNERQFGQNIVTLNTDYKDKALSFEGIFSAQADEVLSVDTTVNGFTLPSYYSSTVNNTDGSTFTEFKPYKSTPKLLFRGTPIGLETFRRYSMRETYPFWRLQGGKQTYWTNNNRFTTYPWGVSGLTHANVWNKNDKFNSNEYDLSDYEDMYDVYYKDYILDLTNEQNRLVKAKIYLTPEEVKSLYWNERILIDGGLFRINKLSNVSLTTPGISDIELVKITREYQPHRVRYYDLIPCDEEYGILHTNTDLNYGIYMFVGLYMKVGGACYQVTGSTYNPSYEYNAINMDGPYNTCGCLEYDYANDYNWYDEKNPQPEPTPIPTPPPCGDCTLYIWENENPFWAGVYYRDCTTGDFVYESMAPGLSVSGCTCDSYTPQPDSGVRVTYTEDCDPGPVPTPTPTPTPTATFVPGPTPTPTRTPTPTPSAGAPPCFIYYITNESLETTLGYEYIPCGVCIEGGPVYDVIPPGAAIEKCACEDTVFITFGTGNIIKGVEC